MTDTFSAERRLSSILEEHHQLSRSIDWPKVQALVEELDVAKRVFFSGQGRSGLMTRAIAIRLMHIGLNVHVAGEPSTPAIGKDDLLIAVSASGTTQATKSHLQTAQRTEARTVLVSAKPAEGADVLIVLPVRSEVKTDQHAGSLFEQGLLLLGDAVCWSVQKRRAVPEGDLDRRHANLQ